MGINKGTYNQDNQNFRPLNIEERSETYQDLINTIESEIKKGGHISSKTKYLEDFCKTGGISYKSFLMWESAVLKKEEPKLTQKIIKRIENNLSQSYESIWCKPYTDIATLKNVFDFNKVIFEAAWTIAPSHEMLTNLKEVSEKMVTIRKSFKKKLELDTVKQLEHEIEKTNLIADLLDDVKSRNITIHAARIPVVMLRGLRAEDFKKYDIDTGTKIGILVVSAIPPKRSDLKPEDILIKPAYGKMQ